MEKFQPAMFQKKNPGGYGHRQKKSSLLWDAKSLPVIIGLLRGGVEGEGFP